MNTDTNDDTKPKDIDAPIAAEAEKPKKPKKEKPKSRSRRWQEAASDALGALSDIQSALADFESAASELRAVQEEYEEWKDNLPENLASSALGEKLEEVCNLDIENAADSLRSAIDDV